MKQKKFLFSLILTLLVSIPMMVSADIVTGKAVDDKTGEPLAMASVRMESRWVDPFISSLPLPTRWAISAISAPPKGD